MTAGGTSPRKPGRPTARPVVTISREAGVGATAVATALAMMLTTDEDTWLAYDRELVERVSEDHNLSTDLVAQFDERDKSWFEHLTAGLTGRGSGTDVPMKVARTIRALSRVGNAVIVGRGGQCVLATLPHVVHVRLYAPLDARIEHFASAAGVTAAEARAAVDRLDKERATFVRSHFHQDASDVGLYDLLLNMQRLDARSAASAIVPIIKSRA